MPSASARLAGASPLATTALRRGTAFAIPCGRSVSQSPAGLPRQASQGFGGERCRAVRSEDNGLAWHKLDLPTDELQIWSLAADPDRIFVGARPEGFRSPAARSGNPSRCPWSRMASSTPLQPIRRFPTSSWPPASTAISISARMAAILGGRASANSARSTPCRCRPPNRAGALPTKAETKRQPALGRAVDRLVAVLDGLG